MSGDSDSRFSALINPIRDLAQNWNVNIASTLEEYLDELENIKLSCNGKELNFAEAALLIQGSTTIYSKKVEHLHALVYQALDLITQQKTNKQENNKTISEKQTEEEDICVWGEDPAFILLDDIVSNDSNHRIQISTNKDTAGGRTSNGRLSIASDVSRASLSLVNSLLHDDRGSGTMKMATCAMDSNGALVIGRPSILSDDNLDEMSTRMHDITNNFHSQLFPAANTQVHEDDHDHDNDNDFDDNGYDGFEDQPGGGTTGTHADADFATSSLTHRQELQNLQLSSPSRSTRQQSGGARLPVGNGKRDPLANPLALLDPHVSAPAVSRQVRKGKTFILPQQRKSAGGNKNKHLSPSSSLVTSHRPGSHVFAVCNSFQSLFVACNSKTDKSQARQRGFQDVEFLQNPQVAVSGRQARPPTPIVTSSTSKSIWSDNRSDPHADRVDEGADWCGDADDDFGEETAVNADQSHFDYFNGVEQALDAVGLTSSYLQGDHNCSGSGSASLSLSGPNFEDLCRQHITNFLRGADKYARETNLSKRVSEWNAKLEPILLEQEERPEFDIHVYSDRTLRLVSERMDDMERRGEDKSKNKRLKDNREIHFSDIVREAPQYEACRMFLACLQLANLGNVDFIQEDHSQLDFTVQLISDSSNRLRVEEYFAPSMINY